VPLIVLHRPLGRNDLGITSVYLQGIANAGIIETVHSRRQPMIPSAPPLHAVGDVRRAARRASNRGPTRRRSSRIQSRDIHLMRDRLEAASGTANLDLPLTR
jgi:hypothetical protein